ncbi:MAG: thioesterase family protein [Actinomycetota bacterium]|nr:thioesterase family protein [Actinomycetota bacterium]MDA8293213.1 thioesterase family protein [Actinomycetota bacterium]
MDAQEFLGMEPTADPTRWFLPVTPAVSTPGRFLFGGCGLAAGIVAMEGAADRPAVWASAQYLSFAPTGSVLRWDVELTASGKYLTQARAIGRYGDRDIITVNAALGNPVEGARGSGATVAPPQVDGPHAYPGREWPRFMGDSIFARVEQRLAAGRDFEDLDPDATDPHSVWWFHIPGHLEPSAATLAILGDYVTGGVSQALGERTMSRSLDNTLRVGHLVPTEWLLCDSWIQYAAGGFAYGEAHLFAEDGTLLGTASQSMSTRPWDPEHLAELAARAVAGATPGPEDIQPEGDRAVEPDGRAG